MDTEIGGGLSGIEQWLEIVDWRSSLNAASHGSLLPPGVT